jgi:hypothetical protein
MFKGGWNFLHVCRAGQGTEDNMKKIVFLAAMMISGQVMAAEVVKGDDGWGCAENGKLIKAGEGGFWATDFPLREGNRCGALSTPLPMRELKKGEEPTWLIFNRKGDQGRGVDPKSPGW